MTRLSTAFAKGHPAMVNLCERGDKDIFSVAEHLEVDL